MTTSVENFWILLQQVYCLHALADGMWVRKRMLEVSSMVVTYTISVPGF